MSSEVITNPIQLFKDSYGGAVTSVITSVRFTSMTICRPGSRCLIDTWLVEALGTAREIHNDQDLVMAQENHLTIVPGFDDIEGFINYPFGTSRCGHLCLDN